MKKAKTFKNKFFYNNRIELFVHLHENNWYSFYKYFSSPLQNEEKEPINKKDFSPLLADTFTTDSIRTDKKGNIHYGVHVVIKPSLDYGSIVHESKHILNYMWKYIGQELDLDNDEEECHKLEEIFNYILDCLYKYTKDKKWKQ